MEETLSVKVFSNHREAVFVRRPNRFLIIARDGDEEIPCHCPNPGRLWEFTFPGARLILERRESKGVSKTQWTAVGVYYKGGVVPLFSARANHASAALVLENLIPNLREIHAEYPIGHSRFDFLCIDKANRRHLIEVKACSLVEYGIAMFPDAPSGRALKHLEELARLSEEGYICHILFTIVHGAPEIFIPNLHTDPALAAGLSRYGYAPPKPARKGTVAIHAAVLRCDSQGNAVLAQPSLPVDLQYGALAEENRGSYLVLLELPEDRELSPGALGKNLFPRGWYIYAGSAMRNLSQRLARHLRRVRKQPHWHLDYLTPYAGVMKALPIMSRQNLECRLARDLKAIGGRPIPGFGSSDCRCESHLYHFPEPPLLNPAFTDLLFRYRHRESLEI